MQYFGGKARIAKPLSDYLNSKLKVNQPFVDLFCGSCNVVSKISKERKRIANDKHEDLIALFKYLQDGGQLPDSVSYDQYNQAKVDPRQWYRAFVGFGCSYAGKYFGGYARGEDSRNYAKNAKNSLMSKMENLQDVLFISGDYHSVVIPEDSLIYCDIPYKNTVGYSVGTFNHIDFYEWCRRKKKEGFTILVSEYKENIPKDFDIVWEMSSKKDIRNKDGVSVKTSEVLMTPT